MQTAPDQYGVVGHPVGHSLSPFIHGMFARDCGQNISYRLYDVAPGEFHANGRPAVERFCLASVNVVTSTCAPCLSTGARAVVSVADRHDNP